MGMYFLELQDGDRTWGDLEGIALGSQDELTKHATAFLLETAAELLQTRPPAQRLAVIARNAKGEQVLTMTATFKMTGLGAVEVA